MIILILFWGVMILKKRTAFALGLLIFFSVTLGQGSFPTAKLSKLAPTAHIILPLEPIVEDLLPFDDNDNKVYSIIYIAIPFLLVSHCINYVISFISFTFFFAFLTAVFFQSNYVINPLGT